MNGEEMLVPLYIRIEEDLYKKIKQVAEKERRSMASLAQVLLKQSLDNPVVKTEENRRKASNESVKEAVDRILNQ